QLLELPPRPAPHRRPHHPGTAAPLANLSSQLWRDDRAGRLPHRELLRRRRLCRPGRSHRKAKEIRVKRMHVHVGVDDLDASIRFYSTLFGADPAVTKRDYAKWMLDDPRVNFAISAGHHPIKGIEHLGIQVENAEELAEV